MTFGDQDFLERGKKAAENITVTSQCLSCGVTFTERFPWYREHEFTCPECGGPIDETAFIEFARQAFEKIQQAKKTDDS